ncbi:MAG: hypothetical protein A2053_01245 [Deltaproteobacteria bacterium GWA2_50_8]|nr:MAG: hypothetical protein A2053_01245 [Deltaproteobacteria bacterium GWA2_50_8]
MGGKLMFRGIIRTRDILLNPGTIISMHGLKGYLGLLFRCLSRKTYNFVDYTDVTTWTWIGPRRHRYRK